MKKLLLTLILGIFLINFISAGVYYNESDGDYGTYTIDTWIPNWLGGDGTSTVKLESNTDQCLINCGFHLSGFNEKAVSLIDDIKFINRKGEDVGNSLLDISFKLGTYQEIEKFNPIYETTCKNVTDLNSTNGTSEVCNSELISNETYYETELVWLDYTGQQVDGYWELKADAKKDLKKPMDWIITFRGKNLNEYEWWNTDWDYKRLITLTANAGEFSYLETITYDANMNNDFSDLRFINGAEDTEFNYTIESKTDGVSAIVRVHSQGETSFYMYYGNAGATTTSNAAATHFNPIFGTYLDSNANDFVGSNDGIVSGATYTASGKIAGAYDFDGLSDAIDLNFNTNYDTFSFNAWIYKDLNVSTHYERILVKNPISGTREVEIYTNLNKLDVILSGGTERYSTASLPIAEWFMVTVVYDQNDLRIYLNGNLDSVHAESGAITDNINNWYLGGWSSSSQYFKALNGKIDEVGIWSRSLTSTEVSELYQYTAPTFTVGAEESHVGGLTIDYVTPPTYENYINTTNTYIPIEVNVTYTDTNFVNITYNVTSTEGYENITTYLTEEYFVNFTNLTTGHYHYNVNVCAEDINTLEVICAATSFRHVNHDVDAPTINLTSPTGTFNYLYENYTLDLNWTVTDEGDNLDSCWFRYGNFTGQTEYTTSLATIIHEKTGAIDDFSHIVPIPSSCKVNGVSTITTRTFTTLSTYIEYNCTNSTGTYVLDTLERPTFFTDEGILTYTAQEEVTCNDNTTTFNYIPDINTLTFYANDTFGNEASESTSWNYNILENSRTFDAEVLEGNYEQFILNNTFSEGISMSNAVLNYAEVSDSSLIYVEGNNLLVVNNLLIPSVSEDQNNTFYWTLTLSDGTIINTTSSNQSVKDINLDNCSTNPYKLMTLFLKDEETRENLTGTIEVNLKILNPINFQEILELSSGYSNVSELNLCSNVLLNSTGLLLDAEIRYYSENYSTEFYHLQRNELDNYPINVSLYDLKDEDTTRFKVTYQNSNLIGIEGAIIQLQRKYLETGGYDVVEAPLTSSDSTAILHIDINTNKYQAYVVKNGEVLGVFENLAFICQSELTGECTLNLFETITPPNFESVESITDFAYSLDPNSTSKTVTVSYSIPSNSPRQIQVLLQKDDLLGKTTICNQTVTSSAGTIPCSYTDSINDATLDYQIYVDNKLVVQKGYVLKDNVLSDYEGVNYFILIVFLLSLTFMFATSPELIVINSVIVILIAAAIWLINGFDFVIGIGGAIWLVIAAIILILKLAKQEDY